MIFRLARPSEHAKIIHSVSSLPAVAIAPNIQPLLLFVFLAYSRGGKRVQHDQCIAAAATYDVGDGDVSIDVCSDSEVVQTSGDEDWAPLDSYIHDMEQEFQSHERRDTPAIKGHRSPTSGDGISRRQT